MAKVQLFLSTVSAEFLSYRERLRHLLTRPDVEVKVQEDFIVTGDETLEMLDSYIQSCDGVIHLVGDMTGAMAKPQSVAAIAQRYPELGSRYPLAEFLQPDGPSLSYTQWEAWLALWHGKKLYIATPQPQAPRDGEYRKDPDQQEQQQAHLARLRSGARYPGCTFTSQEELAAEVLRSFVLDLLVKAGLSRRPLTLPFASIGPLFKGRAELLALLEESRRPLALIGQGGVGKTRLAIEHAWRQIGRCNAVLLVSAGSIEAINSNLASLCKPAALDLREQQLPEEDDQRQAVLHWLQIHPGWLLIFDNVDNPQAAEEVERLLPQLSGGQVVITTRVRNWSAAVDHMEVDVLAPADATAFLLERTADRRRMAPDDSVTAQAIAVEDLGGLALGLEQAGAYINQRRLSLAAYRNQWKCNRQAVLAWVDPRLMQYDRNLLTTWFTSYQQVSESARTLLRRLAWFSLEPFPESLLEVEVPGDPKAAAGAWEAISELEAYSLVNRSSEAPTFTLHRVVQEVVHLWQEQQESPEPNELETALRWIHETVKTYRAWNWLYSETTDSLSEKDLIKADLLLPHIKKVAEHADRRGISEPTDSLCNIAGSRYRQKHVFVEAEPLLRRHLALCDAQDDPVQAFRAMSRLNLAELLVETNRLDEAEPLLRQALVISEAELGTNHLLVATTLLQLGSLLHTTNQLEEAETMLRRALSIVETSMGPDHVLVATFLNSLASLVRTKDQLQEAELLLRRALAIIEATSGKESPGVGNILNSLAVLLMDSGRFEEAEAMMRKSLAIAQASGDSDQPDPSLASRLNNLGLLLSETKRVSEAEPLMRQALGIDETVYGTEHPRVATDLNSLATLLIAKGRRTDAKPLLARTLAIIEASYGSTHPSVAIALNNFSYLLLDEFCLQEAEPLLRRALKITEDAYGTNHPQVATGLIALTNLLYKKNLFQEAEPLMRRALEIFESSHGPKHPEVAVALGNLALLLQETNRQAEAEPLMQRALAIDEASYGPNHPAVARDLGNLGGLLQSTGRLEAAEPLIQRALAIDEASCGSHHPNVARDLNQLAQLLQATNRLGQAEPLIRRALAIDEASYGLCHPNVARDLTTLVELLQEKGRLPEAEPLLGRAFSILLTTMGSEHPKTLKVRSQCTSLLQTMGLSEPEIQVKLQALLPTSS
jgi:tetratricopeptide (TPR) repeat protein